MPQQPHGCPLQVSIPTPQLADPVYTILTENRMRIFTHKLLIIFVAATLAGLPALAFLARTPAAQASSLPVGASPDGLWREISETSLKNPGERRIIPSHYRVFALDSASLHTRLDQSVLEFTPAAQGELPQISLPLPDGSFARFAFVESPVMQPGLAAKFTEIHTYLGRGLDDPSASVRFDWTPHGFHAMILSSSRTVFIDPYAWGNTSAYMSYYRDDLTRSQDYTEIEPLGDPAAIRDLANRVALENIASGSQLRTYRVAIAATGEYTQFQGGTVVAAMAEIVTALNRVTGVYEREVAVRMVLVANNNLIVYTDPNTDPYTNNNGVAMLGQNQTTLDTVIGSANYDIGHVFSTGGGGVAYLGVICESGYKAGGVTGLSAPVGDAFYIDYVAHEMGHQFGANHTFNSTTGSCGGGNRNASTAYEPGSGSTIMAYAGICGADDLQAHSDDYFHGASYDEIVGYTQLGYGNTCAAITNTGNSAPVVTVPAGGFYIPASTPFSLTGSATDANDGSLTYDWEEFDLGPAGHPGTPSSTAPIFRSFNPVSSPTRTFPKLSDLLNNTSTIGELLPSYSRVLTFRLTARDNHVSPSAGGVGFASLSFNVAGSAGPFLVTAPNTAVTWAAGASQTVTWNVANTTASPVSCANVNILFSRDGGYTYPVTLLTATPNDGSQAVVIPVDTLNGVTTARIKVACSDNIFFDISNVDFTVTVPLIPTVDLNGPAGGIDYAAAFTEDAGPISIVAASLTVSDPDSANLDKATVTITNLQNGTAESLAATPNGAITAGSISYNPTTGVLTIDPTGVAPVATFQTVLRSVTYNNTSQNPNSTARLIDFLVNDGTNNNNPLARTTLSVTPVNDAPSFVKGPDLLVPKDSGSFFSLAWATAISPGPEETGQSLTFTLTPTVPGLFSVLPAIDPLTGDLTFTLAPGATGSTSIDIQLQDNGGTANGGADSFFDAFTLTIFLPQWPYYLPFLLFP
jgi:hypothetical protein